MFLNFDFKGGEKLTGKYYKQKEINKQVYFLEFNMSLNYRVLSLGVIICGTLIKACGLYWIYAVSSCVAIAILLITSVILSSSPEKSFKHTIRNPLEQQKIRLGLGCK